MGKGLFCLLVFMLGFSQFILGQSIGFSYNESQNIHANLIVIKLRTPSTSEGRVAFAPQDQLDQLKKLTDYENHHQVFAEKLISNGRTSASHLQNIYKIKFKEGTNIWRKLSRINQLDYIEYAEPFFKNELMYVPNDPQADQNGGLQDYLTVIKAYEGWEITKSDSTMVIGIIDTGVNMNHEDLDNIALNHNDQINGIDDDGDGYIDNYHGWDVGNDDNDPTADDHPHGTHVTGISSAKTDNAIGMAGVGFNSRYLPVNAWNSTSKHLMNEYEGIIYAVDHGAKVINLSWGGVGNKSKYGQDIINYAVLEKDAVIVAAAGNTHDELDFYPASYDNVLSVGATDVSDNLASWATYSHFIDITAPGHDIYSTKNNGGYEKSVGSSFAAPMVAGAAALVRSHLPGLSAQQVMEQLRVTSDDIYDVGSNMDYYGQMGKGRLNVLRALTDIHTPAIRVSEFSYTGNHGDLVFSDDTVNIDLILTNYLHIAENISITITNPSSNVSIESGQIYIERLNEFESYENTDNPISLIVNSDVEPSERLIFRIDITGNNYSDFQYIEIKTAPEYFDISDGNITTTITSDGDIGYNESFNIDGNGVSFREEYIASNTGLIISLDSAHVLDNVINDFKENSRDEDFMAETNVKLYDNSIADYDARSVFKSHDTIQSALDIKVEQKVLAWDNVTNNGYIIFEYRIINTGDSVLNGLNTGIYADWDLGDFQSNEAAWDAADNFGYIFDKSGNGIYAGLALLTNQEDAYYSVDIDSLNGNNADIDSIFNDRLKYEFLAQSQKASAGVLGDGNDVAHIIGGKNIVIQPNESVKVAISMLASNSLEGLRAALNMARSNYGDYLSKPPLSDTFFACDGDSALVDPVGEVFEFYSDASTTQRIDSGYSFKTIPVFNDQEYYMVNLDSGYAGDVRRIVVKPGNPAASFSLETDTLLIENGQSGSIKVGNKSTLSDQWLWDFGNGYSSTVEHPITTYDTPELFNIELIASNPYGCSDTLSQDLLVAIRLERPVVENQQICKGTTTLISASNTDLIEVYEDPGLTILLYTGDEFLTNKIFVDTAFYLVNAKGDFKSAPVKTAIVVKHPEMDFDYKIDTTNFNEKYVLSIMNSDGPTDNIEWRIDNQFLGDGPNINYSYSDQPFDITQVKIDSEGCTDTLRMTIKPQVGSLPQLEDVVVCNNSSYEIIPQNGMVFYFYKNSELTNLVHKGTSFAIDPIIDDTEYFVTGVDGLLESSSSRIVISIDPVKAVIEATSDTINLMKNNYVDIRDVSINSVDSYWLLTTGTFDTVSTITDYFDRPGSYNYTLVAEGFTGCYDTTFQNIQVVQVTGLAEVQPSRLYIYPNPVSDLLTIELKGIYEKAISLELVDIASKRIRSVELFAGDTNHQLNLKSLKNGVYFIRTLNEEEPLIVKILKQ